MVYITFATRKEAEDNAKLLLAQRLIAGANLTEAVSFFWWQGQMKEKQEVVLIGQTRLILMPFIETLVKENHSYEIPCITAIALVAGNAAFIDWIIMETQEKI